MNKAILGLAMTAGAGFLGAVATCSLEETLDPLEKGLSRQEAFKRGCLVSTPLLTAGLGMLGAMYFMEGWNNTI